MVMAMHKLAKEFYQLLSINREYLDPDLVSRLSVFDLSKDEFRVAEESTSEVERVSSIAMAELKAIANCMISSGYGKECVNIYKNIRKSIIDETLYHLGLIRIHHFFLLLVSRKPNNKENRQRRNKYMR
jgi:exocyst complex protein 7